MEPDKAIPWGWPERKYIVPCVKTSAGQIPPQPGDNPWIYELDNTETGVSLFADTATDLIAEVLGEPQYVGLDDDEALARRTEFFYQALEITKQLVADTSAEQLAAADATEDELAALYQTIREPITGLPGDRWRLDVPLVVIATDYQPYTDLPLPQGEHVLVLDPSDELAFLQSMPVMRDTFRFTVLD